MRIAAPTFRIALLIVAAFGVTVRAQERARLAVLPFAGDDAGAAEAELSRLAAGESGLEPIDPDLARAAYAGTGLAGNLNLTLAQGRSIGTALGADFYLIGRLIQARRAGEKDRSYYEWMAGTYLVDGRTGRLLLFRLTRARGADDAAAAAEGIRLLRLEWPAIKDAIASRAADRRAAVEEPVEAAIEVELTDSDLTGPTEKLPAFYQSLKPVYTAEADLAGITATVELEAVFREDGRVDDIRVVRWAGFGLDESAVATAGMLRFRPAERDGKKLTIRGQVRYNFIRPLARDPALPSLKDEEAERMRRSIQRALNPGMLPGKPPKP